MITPTISFPISHSYPALAAAKFSAVTGPSQSTKAFLGSRFCGSTRQTLGCGQRPVCFGVLSAPCRRRRLLGFQCSSESGGAAAAGASSAASAAVNISNYRAARSSKETVYFEKAPRRANSRAEGLQQELQSTGSRRPKGTRRGKERPSSSSSSSRDAGSGAAVGGEERESRKRPQG